MRPQNDLLNPTEVLLEEWGHGIDAVVNPGGDALGDEGAILPVLSNLKRFQRQNWRV